MVELSFDKENQILSLTFEVPVPNGTADDPEFAKLKKAVEAVGDLRWRQNGHAELLGLSGPLKAWLRLINTALPPKEAVFQTEIINHLVQTGSPEQAEGLKINFHQNPFDTAERYWAFVLGQGHFIDYFFNRLDWYLAPKNRIVTPFPLHVDLESASTCNMNCPMCYRDQLKNTGQMDFDLFKKAIDECATEGVFSVRLSWRGETLTHPRIKEMIRYATPRVKNVSFLTNAFYIDEDMAECFVEAGLSYVAVSFDGIKEIYETIRHPAKFNDSYQRLITLQDKRRQNGGQRPQIRLCTIWPAVKDDPQAYQSTMARVSDYMVCNPYINFKGRLKIKPGFICQYPWERIVVGWDGQAQCCTGWNADDIILGNIQDKTIREMWHSDQMNQIRRIHAQGRRMELRSCAECRHGGEGDPEAEVKDIVKRRH